MKNIFKTSLLFILCSTIFFSCDDTVDILPVAPNSENYFNNEEEYEKADVILQRQKRLIRLISNKEKKLKQYDKTL